MNGEEKHPRLDLRPILLSWQGRIGRATYLLAGIGGFFVKHGLDRWVASAFDIELHLWNYWLPPAGWALFDSDRSPASLLFPFTLLAVSAPFIWIGVLLTIKRLRDCRLPIWLAAGFFAPFLNLLLFALLVVYPGQAPSADKSPAAMERAAVKARTRLLPALVSAVCGLGLTAVGALALQSYGLGLFVGTPFAMGMIAAVAHGSSQPRSRYECLQAALLSLVLYGIGMLLFALEGVLCLVMALPLGLALAWFGAELGYRIQERPVRWAPSPPLVLLLWLPLLMGAERTTGPEPSIFHVTTSIDIDAPPDAVWHQVVAFREIPPPTELLFRAGIAYPVRAEIFGHGKGAVRHCVFSTGSFVEPITEWDEPRRLAFDVAENPPPMREASFYDRVHAPHLDGFFVSQRGEFLLQPLDEGHTRLVGTTWYRHGLWPELYWKLWSDAILHRIHLRVLRHIRHNVTSG